MKKSAVIPIVLATILWGMIGLFTTLMKENGMETFQNVSARSTLAALALIVMNFIRDRKNAFKVDLKSLLIIALTGFISLTLNNMCYFTSIERSGMSVAAVLMYTAPIFVMIFSAIFFKEKITRKKVAALIITFAGCILVSLTSEKNPADNIGILCGLASGFTYGLYSIFMRNPLKKYSPMTVVMYFFCFAALTSYFVVDPVSTFTALSVTHSWIYAILLAILCSSAAFSLYSLGLSKTDPSLASIVATLEIVVATVVGFIAFDQQLAWYNYAGIVLVLAAMVLLNVKSRAEKEKEAEEKAGA